MGRACPLCRLDLLAFLWVFRGCFTAPAKASSAQDFPGGLCAVSAWAFYCLCKARSPSYGCPAGSTVFMKPTHWRIGSPPACGGLSWSPEGLKQAHFPGEKKRSCRPAVFDRQSDSYTKFFSFTCASLFSQSALPQGNLSMTRCSRL